MNNEMIALINSLPDDLKEILVVEDESGNYTLNGDKFQETLDKATPQEKDIIIEIFFRQLCEDQWKDIGWNKIEPLLPVLQSICKDVGFKEVNNPFLNFIKQFYFVNNDYTLTKQDLIKINNLYAKDLISYEEIIGKDSNNELSIIYNDNLYKSGNVDKLYKTWIWLLNRNNISRMNWDAVASEQTTSNIQEMANKLKSDIKAVEPNEIRKTIIYQNPDDANSQFNSSTIIDKVMKLGATNQKVSNQSQILSQDRDMRRNIVNMFDRSTLTTSEKRELLNQIMKDLGM